MTFLKKPLIYITALIVTGNLKQNRNYFRTILIGLLPEILAQRTLDPGTMNLVLRKWNFAPDDEIQKISNLLKRGLLIRKILPFIIFTGSGGLLTVGLKATSPVPQPIASNPTTPVRSSENGSLTPLEVSNPFDSMTFPRAICGSSLPTRIADYPVELYPVFVNFSDRNLVIAKSRFCQDSLPRTREKTGQQVVQIASFTSKREAEQFREFIAREFGSSALVGEESTKILKPPSANN